MHGQIRLSPTTTQRKIGEAIDVLPRLQYLHRAIKKSRLQQSGCKSTPPLPRGGHGAHAGAAPWRAPPRPFSPSCSAPPRPLPLPFPFLLRAATSSPTAPSSSCVAPSAPAAGSAALLPRGGGGEGGLRGHCEPRRPAAGPVAEARAARRRRRLPCSARRAGRRRAGRRARLRLPCSAVPASWISLSSRRP